MKRYFYIAEFFILSLTLFIACEKEEITLVSR